jgi:hypothetical protein
MSNFYRTFSFAGLGFLRQRHLEQLQRIEADSHRLLQEVAVRHGATRDNMKAQLGQDLFALFETSWKRDGYFVEFGATDGIQLSNTYLLEKDFGWKGILAEPATVWHQQLLRNRSASIDLDCVWKETGSELQFTVTPEAEYSTLAGFAGSDSHSRRDGSMQTVRTVSLNDLLKRYNAPRVASTTFSVILISIDIQFRSLPANTISRSIVREFTTFLPGTDLFAHLKAFRVGMIGTSINLLDTNLITRMFHRCRVRRIHSVFESDRGEHLSGGVSRPRCGDVRYRRRALRWPSRRARRR